MDTQEIGFELKKKKKSQNDSAVNESSVKVRPNVFSYSDYRSFLRDMYQYKKSLNSQFSENAFVFQAGFGKNSRGYLGLVLKGKRNLTAKSIIGFSQAMGLGSEESIFFENMVLFNQAKTEKEKVYFFERMKVGARGAKSKIVDVLSSQYRYLNEWHLVVLRELVGLVDFKEDADWIVRRLNHRISKDKVEQGIEDLLNLGLIARNETGKLVISDPIVLFSSTKNNFKNSSKLHHDFCQKAAEEMMLEDFENRAAQLMTLSISQKKFEDLRQELKDFTKMILKKYVHNEKNTADIVVQIGSQLIKLTK